MTGIDYQALAKAESDWNAAADENNQWDTLDFDEKLGLYLAAATPSTGGPHKSDSQFATDLRSDNNLRVNDQPDEGTRFTLATISEKLRNAVWCSETACEKLCEFNPCQCAENYAKVVLDAAGVRYEE